MRCWLHISAGRGPAECCWVVEQLACYLRQLALQEKFGVELLETVPGEKVSTLRSALLAFDGDERLESFMKSWSGTIQWIGKSMFRDGHKRKNWYVSVSAVEPVELSEAQLGDVKVETMRGSGPGGQHANSTDSVVRVTDRKSGLSAISREERSQHLNRKLAMARLQQLLEKRKMQEKKSFAEDCWQHHNEIERGNPVHVFAGRSFKLKK